MLAGDIIRPQMGRFSSTRVTQVNRRPSNSEHLTRQVPRVAISLKVECLKGAARRPLNGTELLKELRSMFFDLNMVRDVQISRTNMTWALTG
jgi:hypothetical protein